MRNKLLLMLFILVMSLSVLVSAAIAFYLDKKYDQNNHFSCRAKVYLTQGDLDYFTLLNFTFDGGKGQFSSVGGYQKGEIHIPRININFDFTYTLDQGKLLMVSTNSELDETNRRLLRPVLADFFLYAGRGFQLRLLHPTQESYLFIEGNVPAFVCVKNTD